MQAARFLEQATMSHCSEKSPVVKYKLLLNLDLHPPRVVKSSRLRAKIAAYLISISRLLCLALLYRWCYCIQGMTTQPLICVGVLCIIGCPVQLIRVVFWDCMPRLAWRPLCHKVNLPSYVAQRPLCHKVNLLRCEARRRHLITTCDIFGTGQTNTLTLSYLLGKNL